ncbi:MAG: hypothetical protein ACP5VR_05435 [Acidimicrobiales bacterium]
MRRKLRYAAIVAALVTAGGVLAWSAPVLAQPRPNVQRARQAAPANALVEVAQSAYGPVLVTGPGYSAGAGFALYMFTGDAFTSSDLPSGTPAIVAQRFECTVNNTTGRFSGSSSSAGTSCTTPWPPLDAPGGSSPIAGPGVKQSQLQVVPSGTFSPGQVEYYGHPLYGFVKDKAPGQFLGEDVTAFGGVFWLVSPNGLPAPGTPELGTELSPSGEALDAVLPNTASTRTLYQFTADTEAMRAQFPFGPPGRAMPVMALVNDAGSAESMCTNACSAVWPPLLTAGRPMVGPGADPRLVGELRRPDGTFQVTYAGWPVYLYYADLVAKAAPGGTNGQYLLDYMAHGVWWQVAPQGGPEPGAAALTTVQLGGGTTYVAATSPSVPSSGPSVVYTFTPATAGGTCTGACAKAWPPLLTSLTPSSGTLSGVGTVQRPDGTFQVTYEGRPLYFFANILGKAPATAGLYPLTSQGATVSTPVSTPYGTFTAVTG